MARKDISDIPYLLVGSLVALQEEIEKAADRLVEKGKSLTPEGRKKVSKEKQGLVSKGDEFSMVVARTVQRALENVGIVTKSDLEDIDNRVVELEKKVSAPAKKVARKPAAKKVAVKKKAAAKKPSGASRVQRTEDKTEQPAAGESVQPTTLESELPAPAGSGQIPETEDKQPAGIESGQTAEVDSAQLAPTDQPSPTDQPAHIAEAAPPEEA